MPWDALVILSEDKWAEAVASAQRHWISPRIEEPLQFARRTRVLLFRHVESGTMPDLLEGFDKLLADRSRSFSGGLIRRS